jgi:hypothetical protein
MIRIVDAEPRHVGMIARQMSEGDCARFIGLGRDPRRVIRGFFRQSSYRRAALLNDEPIAIWGLTGSLMSSTGLLWLRLTEEAKKIPLRVVKECRLELAAMMEMRHEIVCYLHHDDTAAIRFARFFGFEVGEPAMLDGIGFVARRGSLRRVETGDWPTFAPPVGENGPPPFIIYALPRSRTKWLSVFLTYGGWKCYHEHAIFLRKAADIREFLARSRVGSAETAAGPAWHLIHHYRPDIRAVVIRRPIAETVAAMIEAGHGVGIAYDAEHLRQVMTYGDRCLSTISRLPGVVTVQYSDLSSEEACRQIFEHCLPFKFDRDWWLSLRNENIQVDLWEYFRYYHQHKPLIEMLKRDCKRELMRLRRSGELIRA